MAGCFLNAHLVMENLADIKASRVQEFPPSAHKFDQEREMLLAK